MSAAPFIVYDELVQLCLSTFHDGYEIDACMRPKGHSGPCSSCPPISATLQSAGNAPRWPRQADASPAPAAPQHPRASTLVPDERVTQGEEAPLDKQPTRSGPQGPCVALRCLFCSFQLSRNTIDGGTIPPWLWAKWCFQMALHTRRTHVR